MTRSGIRRYFQARNAREIAKLRQVRIGKQSTLGSLASSVSRIERGKAVREATALAYCKVLSKHGAEVSLDELFKLATPHVRKGFYNWTQVSNAARRVGREIFRDFKANTVLSFPGPGAIFANLAMTMTLSKEEIVKTPVYTAFFLHKRGRSVPGFSEVTTAKFKILLPTALVKGDSPKWRRIAIVDDSITTGWSMKALTDYLCGAGYKRANIKTACCVCYQGVKIVHGEEPDISPFRASVSHYRMPWGYAYSFESCFEVSSDTSPAGL